MSDEFDEKNITTEEDNKGKKDRNLSVKAVDKTFEEFDEIRKILGYKENKETLAHVMRDYLDMLIKQGNSAYTEHRPELENIRRYLDRVEAVYLSALKTIEDTENTLQGKIADNEEEYKKQIQKLALELTLKQADIAMLTEDKAKLQEKYDTANQRRYEMEGTVADKDFRILTLEKQTASLEAEKNELLNRIHDLREMEKNFNQVKAEAEEYKEKYELQTQACELNRDQIREMREEHEAGIMKLRKEHGEELEREIKRLEQLHAVEIDKVNAEIERLRQLHAMEVEKIKAEIEGKNAKDVLGAKEQVIELMQQINVLTKENEMLKRGV